MAHCTKCGSELLEEAIDTPQIMTMLQPQI